MSYSVRIKRSATRELARIAQQDRERLIYAIDRLGKRPFTGIPLKGNLRGLRRVRVGNYRVVYQILNNVLTVLVVRVAHRRDAYRH